MVPQDQSLRVHERIQSVDAFRGLVMSRMIVGIPLLAALHQLPSSSVRNELIPWLSHAPWHGLTPVDFSFAAYVLIIGISITLSLRRRIEHEQPTREVYRRIAQRTVLLFLLGVIYNGGASTYWPNIRLAGVLQRLAICYSIGALIYLHVPVRERCVLAGAILLGYWGLLALVSVPGHGPGNYSFEGNLAAYVDRHYLPGAAYYGTWDPEGILTTIPAIGSTLLGILIGEWLLERRMPKQDKVLGLLGAGTACLSLSLIWNEWFPINKSLWTSSYVLCTAGITCLLLGVLYQIIDVWQKRHWAIPLIVVGRNLLIAFFLVQLFPYKELSRRLVGGNVGALFGGAEPIILAMTQSALIWLVLYWLYRHKLLIKL